MLLDETEKAVAASAGGTLSEEVAMVKAANAPAAAFCKSKAGLKVLGVSAVWVRESNEEDALSTGRPFRVLEPLTRGKTFDAAGQDESEKEACGLHSSTRTRH
jgi:hypothetical protein